MIISSTVNSQPLVSDSQFKTAGWCAIFAMLFAIPLWIIGFLYLNLRPLLFIYIPLVVAGNVFWVYVLVQFKRLLNERYDFHSLNAIIIAQIVINLTLCVEDILVKIIMGVFTPVAFLGILQLGFFVLAYFLLGILGIVAGIRLLEIREDPSRLLRTLAIITIVSSFCFVSIILLPIGYLIGLANSVILAIIFFRAADVETQVEFV